MADALQEANIDNFIAVTGASKERATFYLQSSGWELQVLHASMHVCVVSPITAHLINLHTGGVKYVLRRGTAGRGGGGGG